MNKPERWSRNFKPRADGEFVLYTAYERLRLAFEGYIRDRRHLVEMSDEDVEAEMDEWIAVAEDVEDVE